jgi:ATP-dependent DNA helicase RecQ
MTVEKFLAEGLWLDLEIVGDQLHAVGGYLGDESVGEASKSHVGGALAQLDRLATRARYVAGHNVVEHDLPFLQAHYPNLHLLKLPVVDTLLLSPLAFPENPYHRLVKDYKLVHSAVNDPLADARLAAVLLQDELTQFQQRRQKQPALAGICHATMTGELVSRSARQGNALFFQAAGIPLPQPHDLSRLFTTCFADRVCRTALNYVLRENAPTTLTKPAMGYAAAWLSVAGHNSVLPPWVRRQYPETGQIIERLRGVPCTDSACEYCAKVHNPHAQLKKFFGFGDFRPLPAAPEGGSLQEQIVRTGMANKPLLAILPTGGGKSLCFQLPALARHFQLGALTIVISPLQALMKDQVDNLVAKTGLPLAGALNGMLTPPERGDTLERVRLGDIALLYVAPEQLRNRSFRQAIEHREIGAWVFDEAHCLSKWGHDFRPDYLYASRFIRELAEAQGQPAPPVMCYTATAKTEVVDEIVQHFRESIGQDLVVFRSDPERENLLFEVQPVTAPTKWERTHELLREHIGGNQAAAAVVYSSTRKGAEDLTKYLISKNWRAAAFHAGLDAADKRRIQEEFLADKLQVICATNAFGMGIDKENVRLVLHADIPGSLENYVQEAGRAGRDQQEARCILLFDQQDIERQFSLGALSQLSRRDVAGILRGLRRARRNKDDEVVLTSGELLREEGIQVSFGTEDTLADTKVRTAIALLERGGFIQRNENQTQVFQGRPLVKSCEEAREKMTRLNIPPARQAQWEAILLQLFNSRPDDGFSADELAELPALREAYTTHCNALRAQAGDHADRAPRTTTWVMRLLQDMAEAGLIKRDMLLTAFVKHGGPKSPRRRFEKLCALEETMLKILSAEAPDADGWMNLCTRSVNQRLCDEGHTCAPEVITGLLRDLAMSGRGVAGSRDGLEFRPLPGGQARVRLQRDWNSVFELAARRRAFAGLALNVLTNKIPPSTPQGEECLVAFTGDDILKALEADIVLAAQVRDRQQAIERSLLFLHEQRIIILQKGLAVFRQSMTIRVQPESRGRRFLKSDFEPLEQHYGQRVFQVHVMNQYARLGVERIREALALVLAYFTLDRKEFIRRFFPKDKEMLERATTVESYQRIVESLGNPVQQGIVTAGTDDNLLILAGPGSGKTRVVVHRCAYLLRVERVPAAAILVLCFNRHAALDARHRLRELVGAEARFITVQTYHGLAMRLAGASFTDRPAGETPNFDAILDRAIQLLRGEVDLPGVGEDELRDRLLAGYRYILVDEYQDIDEKQYALVSAIAGRTLADDDSKLTILAVGDDDQNVYAFRGANVEYIRRFQQDYKARVCHLLENYRSTSHIIAAANYLIAHNRDRMKTQLPIRIDRTRVSDSPGGLWQSIDPVSRGRVQVLGVADAAAQAPAVLDELQRLRGLRQFDWSTCVVLASTHDELATIRTLCEHRGIPVRWTLPRDASLPLSRIREVDQFLTELRHRHGALIRAGDLQQLLPPADKRNHWHRVVLNLLEQWQETTENTEQPAEALTDFIHTALAEERREQRFGHGLLLSTVHGAKGLEYDLVVILGGGWQPRARGQAEEAHRLFYVGMTRARQTLTLIKRVDFPHPFVDDLRNEETAILRRAVRPTKPLSAELLQRRYTVLGYKDIFLDYAGQRDKSDPIHAALAHLKHGDRLEMRHSGKSVGLFAPGNVCVAPLSQSATAQWRDLLPQIESVRLLALCTRRTEDVDVSEFRQRLRTDQWQIPIVEITWRG